MLVHFPLPLTQQSSLLLPLPFQDLEDAALPIEALKQATLFVISRLASSKLTHSLIHCYFIHSLPIPHYHYIVPIPHCHSPTPPSFPSPSSLPPSHTHTPTHPHVSYLTYRGSCCCENDVRIIQ